MKVTKLAPYAGKVHEEIDRVFDRFFGDRFFNEPLLPPFALEPMGVAWIPVLDMMEAEKEYLVRVEVPGIPKENLDINITGELLTVTGRREAMQETKSETYLWKEREVGRFVRTIRLPGPVMENKVEAAYQDGVLTIHIPKVASAVGNKILIK